MFCCTPLNVLCLVQRSCEEFIQPQMLTFVSLDAAQNFWGLCWLRMPFPSLLQLPSCRKARPLPTKKSFGCLFVLRVCQNQNNVFQTLLRAHRIRPLWVLLSTKFQTPSLPRLSKGGFLLTAISSLLAFILPLSISFFLRILSHSQISCVSYSPLLQLAIW